MDTRLLPLLLWAMVLFVPVASQGGVPLPVEDYAYDEEGNRTASHLSAAHLTSDHNQLLEDDSYTYAYDDRGNRVSRTSKATGDVETYLYDSQNRLIGYSSPTTEATYAYDALDRRIAKTVGGVVTSYIYDMSPADPLAYDDITLEFTDGILTRRWSHSDAVDEPLGLEAYAAQSAVGSGAEHAIYADRQGSVIWVTDPATGAVVAGYEYDAYGQITQTTGVLKQPYGYTGREYDAESGLYHYRARAYDPANGVFLQVDPIEFEGGQFSIYNYVANNPAGLTDPTGLSSASYMVNTNLSAAQAKTVGYGIGTGLVFLLGQIINELRDISKIHLAPGTALRNPPQDDGSLPPPPPPGDCTKKQQEKMQSQKNEADARAKSCNPSDSIGKLVWNRANLEELRFRRAVIMALCFRGGDDGHRKALAQVQIRIEKCNGIIATRIRGYGN